MVEEEGYRGLTTSSELFGASLEEEKIFITVSNIRNGYEPQ